MPSYIKVGTNVTFTKFLLLAEQVLSPYLTSHRRSDVFFAYPENLLTFSFHSLPVIGYWGKVPLE